MIIFYFTSTGNSLAVAKKIGGTLISIPQLSGKDSQYYEDDVIGLVFPIYGFIPPSIVRKFLKRVNWKADYVFAVATYGDTYADFCQTLKKLCQKRGLKLDYCNTLKMVDNALVAYEMAEQIRTLPKKRVGAHLAEIMADIGARKSYIKPMQPNTRKIARKVHFFNPIMTAGIVGKMKIKADDSCNGCGICAKLCPRANITVNRKAKLGSHCASCLGCIHNCPQGALHFKGEKSTVRFRNPDVTLQEIIVANQQKQGRGT